MRYIAILDTDEYEDFDFFKDGNGEYLRAIDAGAVNGEWIYLPFKPLEPESRKDNMQLDSCENHTAIPIEEIEAAWESIGTVAEGRYVDMEEVKLWFSKWLNKELDE